MIKFAEAFAVFVFFVVKKKGLVVRCDQNQLIRRPEKLGMVYGVYRQLSVTP